MDYVVQLIGEGWHRRRRRRRTHLAVASLVVLSAAAAFLASAAPRARPQETAGFRIPPRTATMAPSAEFSQSPYMGVHCSVPNLIACDRVGLAIWRKRPAFSVRASIAGDALPLDWFGDEHRLAHLTKSRAFDGYLKPAGIVSKLHVRPTGRSMWYGDPTPSPMVWVLINYGYGRYVLTHLRVPLMAGWG